MPKTLDYIPTPARVKRQALKQNPLPVHPRLQNKLYAVVIAEDDFKGGADVAFWDYFFFNRKDAEKFKRTWNLPESIRIRRVKSLNLY